MRTLDKGILKRRLYHQATPGCKDPGIDGRVFRKETIMDTSKEYIKMCEKAEEIQKHTPEAWDYYVCLTHLYDTPPAEEIAVLSGYETDGGTYGPNVCKKDYCDFWKFKTWLPRQDQLQEMLKSMPGHRMIGWARQLEGLLKFANDDSRNFTWSWEQFWIAFVMKEKYNKIWDGETWIETTKKD